ncbi:hypothetical protein KKB28_04180, partial [bacterium]|nr:hypothetical protein [bacterium]
MKHLKSTQRVASFKTSPRKVPFTLRATISPLLQQGGLRGVRAAAILLLLFVQASFAQLSGPLSGTLG